MPEGRVVRCSGRRAACGI